MTPPCSEVGITTSVGFFWPVSFFSALLSSGPSTFPTPLHPESTSISAPDKINIFDNFMAGSPFQRQAQDRRGSIDSQKVSESIARALRFVCAALQVQSVVACRLPGNRHG